MARLQAVRAARAEYVAGGIADYNRGPIRYEFVLKSFRPYNLLKTFSLLPPGTVSCRLTLLDLDVSLHC